MADTVVIGGSAGAMRAAALEAHRGASVVLLTPHPLNGLVLPEGRGTWVGDGGEAAKALYGGTQVVEADLGIWFRGRSWKLPLRAEQLAQLVPPDRVLKTALGWGAARAAIELAELIGGGHEQRSYSHWVERRFGRAAMETLYRSYCHRRFGEPEELSCNVARLFHGIVPGELYAPQRPLHLGHVDVQVANVQRIHAGKVETDQGTVEGRVLVDALPLQVLQWLGEPADSAASQDAARLTARQRVTVCLVGAQNLPRETHVLDDSVRFYRIVRPGLLPGFEALSDRLLVHYAMEDQAAGMPDNALVADAVEGLARLGIQAEATGALVQRGQFDQPSWEGVHLSRMRRYMMVLEERDIVPVGRSGLHSFADPSEELLYLQTALAPGRASLRACYRDTVEPPVEDPSRAHLRRFLER